MVCDWGIASLCDNYNLKMACTIESFTSRFRFKNHYEPDFPDPSCHDFFIKYQPLISNSLGLMGVSADIFWKF